MNRKAAWGRFLGGIWVLGMLFLSGACGSSNSSSSSSNQPAGIGDSSGFEYNFTLWVETSDVPDASYYDSLAAVVTSSPSLSFNKIILRVTGVGADSGGPWYDAMNPAGNSNNPYILEILRKLEGTGVAVYALPYLSKTVKLTPPIDDERWVIYSDMADDASSLQTWWSSEGVSDSYYNGSLKQAIRWVGDINNLAAQKGISTRFTGIVFEPEGSPYPNDERTPQAIATYKQTYNVGSLKVGMTGAASQGAAYSQYGLDGVLDEGYLQLYNLTDTPQADPNNVYIDAMAAGAISGGTVPVFPNSIYTDALAASSPSQALWGTDPSTWKPGQDLGFQHSHDASTNIGLLNWDFYNGGSGYTYNCAPGKANCAKIYFMFSTECGDADGNVPQGIQCDCLFTGCPQSQINAFGTWGTVNGLNEFLNFLDLANADWQLPTDQFAIFQYQLLPNAWVTQ